MIGPNSRWLYLKYKDMLIFFLRECNLKMVYRSHHTVDWFVERSLLHELLPQFLHYYLVSIISLKYSWSQHLCISASMNLCPDSEGVRLVQSYPLIFYCSFSIFSLFSQLYLHIAEWQGKPLLASQSAALKYFSTCLLVSYGRGGVITFIDQHRLGHWKFSFLLLAQK